MRRTLILPVLLLIFFLAAPSWYEANLHSMFRRSIIASVHLSPAEKAKRIAYYDQVNFETACSDPPLLKRDVLHIVMEKDGVCTAFDRLWWGLVFSAALVVILIASMLTILSLNLDAKKSAGDLVRNHRVGWKIAMVTALIKLVLLIPLLSFGCFEFTFLLCGKFLPQLLILFVLGGVVGLVTCLRFLLGKIPMEIAEPMCREVTPEEAPELWDIVRQAAAAVQTAPPDRILVGIKPNFFVTELAVKTDAHRVTGRTLFLSGPLLKQFSFEEVVAVIGHELAHFKGKDTAITREFFPFRLKTNQTIQALARSGPVGWPSLGLLSFFNLTFEKTFHRMSRARELVADQTGASLTSADALARALVKHQVFIETAQRMAADTGGMADHTLMDLPWQRFIDEKIPPTDSLWAQLAEKKLPHPLDTHPNLEDRLKALGGSVELQDARAISLQQGPSAYDYWFAHREDLFADLNRQAGELQAKSKLIHADYKTVEGKVMLDRYFPEKRWKKKRGPVLFMTGVFVFLALAALYATVIIPSVAGRIVVGVIGIATGLIAAAAWHSRKSEVTLTAGDVYTTAWRRPLRFEEVASIQFRRINSRLIVRFNLKNRQRTLLKWSVVSTTNFIGLIVSGGLTEKPLLIAQTIHRYFHRIPVDAAGDGLGKPKR